MLTSFMTQSAQEPSTSREFVKQSSLYQEFLAEREEILRHKWLESERLGYDIGFERALLDWIRKHRESWRAARRQQQHLSTSFSSSHSRTGSEKKS
jgi:hypothetical protein